MSRRCDTWVWEKSDTNGNDRLVLLAIADEADDDGTNAYPSIERIAMKARVNRATAMRAISRLEAAGELLVERPEKYGRGRHNTYVVLMGRDPEKVAECDPSGNVAKGRGNVAKGRAQVRPDPQTHRPTDEEPSASIVELAANLDKSVVAARFERFWEKYPRRTDKGGARKAYEKAARAGLDVERAIWSGVQRFAADPNLPEAQFIPHASTWLNGERWNDGPLPPRKKDPQHQQRVGIVVDEDRTGTSGRLEL